MAGFRPAAALWALLVAGELLNPGPTAAATDSEDLAGVPRSQASAPTRDYRFDGAISREALENYLSRAITMEGLLNGRGDLDDNLRMLKGVGAKFIGRSLCLWGGEADLLRNLERARQQVPKVHATDPEMVLQACIFEIVTTQVEQVPVPDWAFAAFGLPVQRRNFRYADMLYPDGQLKDHWRAGQSVPDVSQTETKLWFYFLGASFVDVGCEAIHLGQTELMNHNDRRLDHYAQVLALIRSHAAKHARRHLVLLDSHVPSGGLLRDGQLLMDFHSFPLRIMETPDKPQEAILKVGFSDGIYGRSKGGMTASGWRCEHLPYLVEIDNWGVSRTPGEARAGSIWIWGYDEITWFAHQSREYRSNWLSYAWNWVRQTDPNGFLQMPGSRTLRSPRDNLRWYYANEASAAVPEGFGDEPAIRAVWQDDGRGRASATGPGAPWLRPYDGPTRADIDATTLDGKVLCGYQGWFNTPGDGGGFGFVHWGQGLSRPDGGRFTVDMWPDTSEYAPEDLEEVPGLKMPDGSPARLYSAFHKGPVLLHFQWMRQYGIDGVFLSRFIGEAASPSRSRHVNQVLAQVREGCHREGRVWAMMLDLSTGRNATTATVMNDWKFLCDQVKVREDSRYLHHQQKPVVLLWGLGFRDRPWTPEQGEELIRFFKDDPRYGGVYLIGGIDPHWRTLGGESRTNAGWAAVYRKFDAISPWNAGRYRDDSSMDRVRKTVWEADLAELKPCGVGYLPTAFPGFSWDNLRRVAPGTTNIPRRKGEFYWRQFAIFRELGIRTVFVGMFDEVDEGTAIYKVANVTPVGKHFVTYEGLPADWYLRLTGAATQMIRGETPYSLRIPETLPSPSK